jgi:2-dehydropantoate 2-reductase
MKVCIYGAGAVGGHLAARLIAAGKDQISLIARGPHLEAIKQHGIRLHRGDEVFAGHPFAATDDPSQLEPQDVVIVTLKAQALPAAAASIKALLAKDGVAVFAINGLPWWWNQGMKASNGHLPLLDPTGSLWELLRHDTLGCVIYSPNEVTEPGVILGAPGDRWVFGEPDNSDSARLQKLIAVFERANIHGVSSLDVRINVWQKLIINVGLNPTAALARLPTVVMTSSEGMKEQMKALMREALLVAKATGYDIADTLNLDELVTTKKRPGSHRASMYQDVLAGRSLESEAILGQLVELAHQHNVPVPKCEIVLELLRGLDQSMRLG